MQKAKDIQTLTYKNVQKNIKLSKYYRIILIKIKKKNVCHMTFLCIKINLIKQNHFLYKLMCLYLFL